MCPRRSRIIVPAEYLYLSPTASSAGANSCETEPYFCFRQPLRAHHEYNERLCPSELARQVNIGSNRLKAADVCFIHRFLNPNPLHHTLRYSYLEPKNISSVNQSVNHEHGCEHNCKRHKMRSINRCNSANPEGTDQRNQERYRYISDAQQNQMFGTFILNHLRYKRQYKPQYHITNGID